MSIQCDLMVMSYRLKEDAREALNQANYHAEEEKRFRDRYNNFIRKANDADRASQFLRSEQSSGEPA